MILETIHSINIHFRIDWDTRGLLAKESLRAWTQPLLATGHILKSINNATLAEKEHTRRNYKKEDNKKTKNTH